MINDIISNPVLQTIIQIVVMTNRISILNIILKILTSLPHYRKGMSNLTYNVANKYNSYVTG